MTKSEYQGLVRLLRNFAYHYYVMDRPMISDEEYDAKYVELRAYEENNPQDIDPESPTQKIVFERVNKLAPVGHAFPMLSLRTVTEQGVEVVAGFIKSTTEELGETVEYCAELKYDGLALDLEYIRGELSKAATRGDTMTGEDVTHCAKTISNIPKFIPQLFGHPSVHIRGEAYIRKSDFDELNRSRKQNGETTFVNPRNAASGSIRQLDASVCAKRPLVFSAYSLLTDDAAGLPITQSETLRLLEGFGFSVSQFPVASTAEELLQIHTLIGSQRADSEIPIDGVVYKVNNFDHQRRLGFVSKEPRWAIAHKFPAERASTALLGVDFQVTRYGNVVPVAKMAPVFVGGVTVASASLHNVFHIRRKKIRYDQQVVLCRAGDVIPQIVESYALDDRYRPNIRVPKQCPSCGSIVRRSKGQVVYRCRNLSCPDQLVQRLAHLVSRTALDIKGVGDSVCTSLVEFGMVRRLSDFFLLSDISVPTGCFQGDEHARLLTAIDGCKNKPFKKVLYAVGIEHVGLSTAEDISRVFKDPQSLSVATVEDLCQIPDVGEVVANSIVQAISDKERLAELELVWSKVGGSDALTEGLLSGARISITGSFDQPRHELAAEIENMGGKVTSVSSKTNALLCGQTPGDSLTKARKLEIPIFNSIEEMKKHFSLNNTSYT